MSTPIILCFGRGHGYDTSSVVPMFVRVSDELPQFVGWFRFHRKTGWEIDMNACYGGPEDADSKAEMISWEFNHDLVAVCGAQLVGACQKFLMDRFPHGFRPPH